LSKAPDTSKAAKSGQPTMTSLRPTIPVSVPVPGGAQGGVTDVTISTGASDTSALDTQPDARLSQQSGRQPETGAAKPEPPADEAKPAAAAAKKGDSQKKKEQRKKK
jgi:hypothetical protein